MGNGSGALNGDNIAYILLRNNDNFLPINPSDCTVDDKLINKFNWFNHKCSYLIYLQLFDIFH